MREVKDESSGAILFKKDSEELAMERLIEKLIERITFLEERIETLERCISDNK